MAPPVQTPRTPIQHTERSRCLQEPVTSFVPLVPVGVPLQALPSLLCAIYCSCKYFGPFANFRSSLALSASLRCHPRPPCHPTA